MRRFESRCNCPRCRPRLAEGEAPCCICGDGARAHTDGSCGHPMPPLFEYGSDGRELMGPWFTTVDSVLNRPFTGRLRWLLTGK
jgi:hypothetical protein